MKKVIFSLLFSAGLVSALAAASSNYAPVVKTQAGTFVNNVAAQNLTFVGGNAFRIEVSTPADTPVLLLSGQGLLYGVMCSSGAAGSYAMAFDASSASGITVGTLGSAISPEVVSPGIASSSISGAPGVLDLSKHPVPFVNGLVGITHGGTPNCIFQARLSTGDNPGP